MVSKGCSYGQCTYCAEAMGGKQRVVGDFSPLARLIEAHPGAAIYFQDSIFPSSRDARLGLLPILRESGRPWGCQVYLPTLSRGFVRLLAEHGCTYVYTGVESGSEVIRSAVGKSGLRDSVLKERLGGIGESGMLVGVSLMFGCFDSSGQLLETQASVASTVEFTQQVVREGVDVAGFYPNVLTVLPGTPLARGLAAGGQKLDFYRMPRVSQSRISKTVPLVSTSRVCRCQPMRG